jgi:hypothetical protein
MIKGTDVGRRRGAEGYQWRKEERARGKKTKRGLEG